MTLQTAPAAIPSAAERILRGFALALGGSLLLAVSAKVQVPFYPVPMTMQTLVVLLIGAALGARLAAASVALYLIEGLAGLPVFAGAVAGPLYMAGPTGGFLVGFLAAAALIGFVADRRWDRSWIRLLGSLSLGHAVVFVFGFVVARPVRRRGEGVRRGRRAFRARDDPQDVARRHPGRRRQARCRADGSRLGFSGKSSWRRTRIAKGRLPGRPSPSS